MAPNLGMLEELQAASVIAMMMVKSRRPKSLPVACLDAAMKALAGGPWEPSMAHKKSGPTIMPILETPAAHGRPAGLGVRVDIGRKLPQFAIPSRRHREARIGCGRRRGLHIDTRILRGKAREFAAPGEHCGGSEQRACAAVHRFAPSHDRGLFRVFLVIAIFILS